ncbi:spermatogenesis-associated protein 48 [Pristis pectinata]|uniref:spermatogenesis-associated protein 48 n=1 Tax=Pristis pectinata TaxID=685728 RepID=UPI00223C9B96|nr:spermatogenesis-associated protein 48 [Pristis pectinata]
MTAAVSLARPARAGQTVIPFVRGPEDRHFFTSFQDQSNVAFARWSPYAQPPEDLYPPAPHRHDVPLLDLTSGFRSVASGAAAGSPRLPSTPFHLAPAGNCRARTAVPVSARPLLLDVAAQARWNSKSVSAEAIRARMGGWTSPIRVTPSPHSTPVSLKTHTFNFNVDPTDQTTSDPTPDSKREMKAKKYMYTTTTQRSYEDVNWDCKLPPKVKPADTTQDIQSDPLSRHSALKRFDPSPHVWQAVGGLGVWDKSQSRPSSAVAKPLNFTSPFPRIHQIPLYSGSIGGNNLEDVDNPYTEFTPFTVLRTKKPRQTDTNYCPDIPGYTGKRQWSSTEPNKSNISRMFQAPPDQVQGIEEHFKQKAEWQQYQHHSSEDIRSNYLGVIQLPESAGNLVQRSRDKQQELTGVNNQGETEAGNVRGAFFLNGGQEPGYQKQNVPSDAA